MAIISKAVWASAAAAAGIYQLARWLLPLPQGHSGKVRTISWGIFCYVRETNNRAEELAEAHGAL